MQKRRFSFPAFMGAAALCALSACSFSESMEGHYSTDGGSYYPDGDYSPSAGENYEDYGVNPVVDASEDNKSTFAIDVDTGSYTLMRRDITQGYLPNQAGVRVEEYVNYFDYDYGQPSEEHPFAVHLESAQSHFGEGHELLRVGLQGLTMPEIERSAANLVFLIDVSGSMMAPNKLDLRL